MRDSMSRTNSLSVRLIALIIVPLVGLVFLAGQRIESDRADADAARVLVEAARLDQAVARVYAPAQIEQIALEGLANIDDLGVPRNLVINFIGVDFNSLIADSARLLDTTLDTLADDFGDVTLTDGRPLGVHLAEVRSAMDFQRELSEQERAEASSVRQVFSDLGAVLEDAVSIAGLAGESGETNAKYGELAAASTLLRTAGERGRSLLEGFLDQSAGQVGQTVAADARVLFAAEQLRSALPIDTRNDLDRLMRGLEPLPPSVVSTQVDVLANEIDGELIEESADALLNQTDFIGSLAQFSADLHSHAVDELSADADAADNAAARTQGLVLLTVAISVALVIVIAMSILRPLRRLTFRARTIGSGDFDAEPLSVTGPSDIRALTSTINDMADTLAGVDREITRLADGGSVDRKIELPGTIGQSIDRSFRRLGSMTTRLHASESLASAIVTHAADAIWTIDGDGIIKSANQASVKLLGVAANDQIGSPLHTYVDGLDGETTVEHTTGRVAHVVVSNSKVNDTNVVAVMAHDISERRRFQEQLTHQARHDALTGLPNRAAVLAALDHVEPDQPVAVLFIDLDGFKSVNDMRGHLAGDRVLAEVGNRLQGCVRDDDVVGRLGGDEFVIMLDGIASLRDTIDFAERIVGELARPYRLDASTFTLSASVGVACFLHGLGADHLEPLDAIQRADSAVYVAKERGRGSVEVFTTDLNNQLTRDAEIEHTLREAIINNELELYLQPTLDLRSNVFTSAEALIRWNRPGIGLVLPGDFIPIAETSSLIEEIGRWVIETACRTLADWKQADPMSTRRLAINISGSHLLEGDLVGDVDAALLTTGADPTTLEIELTETQLMNDYAKAKLVLARLRKRGVSIAIDDFGTGYSSMAYLRELPVDTLKIDRSFVTPLGHPDADTTVADALVTIGHALELSVVAEGIETQRQLTHLTQRGCDRAQGFLLARPQPIAQAKWLVGSQFDINRAPD